MAAAAMAAMALVSTTAMAAAAAAAAAGTPTAAAGGGPFEHALGHGGSRYGRSTAALAAAPGGRWDYSCAATAHLSLAFRELAGR